jgi:hypothetical protein
MTDPKIINALAVFSAGYLKRWLEKNLYDKAFQSEIGQKLGSLDAKEKYAIEAGLNLLTAFFDQKLTGDTVLLKILKQVGTDVAPEISSRLVQGVKGHVKESASTPKDKDLADVLAEMDGQVLIDLLKWLSEADPKEKTEVLSLLSRLSSENIAKIAKLSPSLLTVFAGLSAEPAQQKKTDRLAAVISEFNDKFEKWLDSRKGDNQK